MAPGYVNRVAEERRTRYAAPPTSSPVSRGGHSTRHYGPQRTCVSRAERDRNKWAWMYKDEAKEDEHLERERNTKLVEKRISEEEASKLETLTVKLVDFHIALSAGEHHTTYYPCTKGDNAQLVLRRGQEFTITLVFNRPYDNEKDDLIFIIDADGNTPGKNLREEFKLDEKAASEESFQKQKVWGARILGSNPVKKLLKVALYVPADCVVGEWDFMVKTQLLDKVNEDLVYVHPKPIIILFNPWSKDDLVYMQDEDLLKEYILNSQGSVYSGSSGSPGSRPWTYGQFEDGILHIGLSLLRKAFGFKMTPAMADPVRVARALSRIVNSSDDQGLLVGNWSGDYSGGQAPMSWKTSTAILRKYEETGMPVKYGQCWVFSHTLTTVCRTLGFPCRSVTTFDSAHDTDSTCTIDRYFTADGKEVTRLKSDSIWNFHVWNEVWMLRPELSPTGDSDGWHAIDATPQEQSDGVYQCGPCPVQAVKKGEITQGYDTAFVFGEVNAEVVDWIVDEHDDICMPSGVRKNKVGTHIFTKPADGKAHKPGLNWSNVQDASLVDDVTHSYKFPEGSEEETEAVRRAVRFTKHGSKLYKDGVLEVTLDPDCHPTLADVEFVVKANVTNVSKENRDVTMILAVRRCSYWNRSQGDQCLAREQFDKKTVKAGETEEYKLTLKTMDCLEKCDEHITFFAYACAMDVKTSMPHSHQRPYRVRRPDLEVKGPEKAVSGKAVTVAVSITNPLRVPLTDCNWELEGDLRVADDDSNQFAVTPHSLLKKEGNVNPGETRTLTAKVYGKISDEQESGSQRSLAINFACKEIPSGAKGTVCLVITKRPS